MFNQIQFQNSGNLIVNNNNDYNNNNYNKIFNYMNQNNYINLNKNQAYNNFNQINKSINLNSSPNYGNNFINIDQNKNKNQINNQNQNGSNNIQRKNQSQNNSIYLFPTIGLNNIGPTFYMNATLQFLLHVSELTVYFLSQYPDDKNNLNEKNKLIKSHGQISNAFYELVKGVCEAEYKTKKKSYTF